MRSSFTALPNLFQLFQPIGGVRASSGNFWPWALRQTRQRKKRILFMIGEQFDSEKHGQQVALTQCPISKLGHNPFPALCLLTSVLPVGVGHHPPALWNVDALVPASLLQTSSWLSSRKYAGANSPSDCQSSLYPPQYHW